MKTVCPKCGRQSGSGNSGTTTYRRCSTCLQTEELARIAKQDEQSRIKTERGNRERERVSELNWQRENRERDRVQKQQHDELLRNERNRMQQGASYQASQDSHNLSRAEDGETADESFVSDSYYETPKKRSCLGCIFKLVILAIVGFLALAALGHFLDKGENKISGEKPAESESTSATTISDTQGSKNTTASPDQGKAPLRPETSKSPTNSVAAALAFENQKFPLFVIVTERD